MRLEWAGHVARVDAFGSFDAASNLLLPSSPLSIFIYMTLTVVC
jgi:hypothetical protein